MISPECRTQGHNYCLTLPHPLWVDFLLQSLLEPGPCWPFGQESVEEEGEFGRGGVWWQWESEGLRVRFLWKRGERGERVSKGSCWLTCQMMVSHHKIPKPQCLKIAQCIRGPACRNADSET